jgi:HEAT repeat protein
LGNEAFRAKLARIEALRDVASPDRATVVRELQKALRDRSNYAVAKAAAVAGSLDLVALVPDLLAAYHRLFADESDPLVLGKNAIAKALKHLDHRDPAPFVRGVQHVQLEPVWGGHEDHAGGLRATCAHALTACDMDGAVRLELLTDRLVDADRMVRREAVRAIATIGGHEGVLLVRLKALAGDADPEVVGECFVSLLDLDPERSVAFVERFLANSDEEVVVEALAALAGSRVEPGFDAVRRFWAVTISPTLRRAIIFSCAASPLPSAGAFLLAIVAESSGEVAAWALSALAESRFRNDLREPARRAAHDTGDAGIVRAYVTAFGPE